jgi:hypothetical protein
MVSQNKPFNTNALELGSALAMLNHKKLEMMAANIPNGKYHGLNLNPEWYDENAIQM